MKLSEVTLENVKRTLRVDYSCDDDLIAAIMESAKGYIKTYTGLDETELDNYPEIIHAFYCLCADMYDNRDMTAQSTHINPTVKQILDSMAVNRL